MTVTMFCFTRSNVATSFLLLIQNNIILGLWLMLHCIYELTSEKFTFFSGPRPLCGQWWRDAEHRVCGCPVRSSNACCETWHLTGWLCPQSTNLPFWAPSLYLCGNSTSLIQSLQRMKQQDSAWQWKHHKQQWLFSQEIVLHLGFDCYLQYKVPCSSRDQ